MEDRSPPPRAPTPQSSSPNQACSELLTPPAPILEPDHWNVTPVAATPTLKSVKVVMDSTLSSRSCYDWLRLGPVMDAPAWSGCTDWEGQAWEVCRSLERPISDVGMM